MKLFYKLTWLLSLIVWISSCGGGGNSISTLSTSDSFDDGNLDYNPKMDILWVVDPSKSMFEEVEKVRNNIAVFMEGFVALGYEYRVAVISTAAWSDEAYLADTVTLNYLYSGGGPVFAKAHQGECVDRNNLNTEYLDPFNVTNFGDFLVQFNRNFDVYGVDADTSGCGLVGPPFAAGYPEVANNFFENSNGYNAATREAVSGFINDERPLQSVRAFLERDLSKPENDRFVRNDAHLAVIIVSDEPDASRNDLIPSPTYDPDHPGNHTANQYINYLETRKGSISNFSIYSIVDTNLPKNIAREAATLSGGLAFDINASQEDYVQNLSQISAAILVSSSYFPIQYKPIPSTIEIQIIKENGTIINVPRDTGSGGFTYIAAQQGVTISADYLPAQGDSLKINYTPEQLISGVSDQPRLSLSNLSIAERPAFAGVSPNPGDTGYEDDTHTKNGSVVGTVSLLHRDSTGGTFAIVSSDPAGAYAIDPTTGVVTVANAALFDTETRGRHKLEVSVSIPDVVDAYTRSFLISVSDIPDSVATAVADNYTVSESVADESGVIRVYGNLSYNDTGVDASETHTWKKVTDPVGNLSGPLGNIVINANGSFTYTVNASALNGGTGLDATDHEIITFDYNIEGTPVAGNISNTVTVTIRINGFNQAPELYNPINDVLVEFSGGLIKIPLVAGDVTSSGFASGTADSLVDGNAGTSARTSGANAQWIQLNFPGGTLWEVDRFEINGVSSLGNAVFQVRAAGSGQVVSREVLPINMGTNLTIDMSQKVIGGGVRILRPRGATNSNGHHYLELNEVEVWGIEAESETIDLTDHFRDLDPGDSLTFYATDAFGEGPAPGWATISGSILSLLPGSGVDMNIGVLAQDTSGATAFTVFNVKRAGFGSGAPNSQPIAMLPLDDEKRGGLSMRRWGGGASVSGCTIPSGKNNLIQHIEIDNFLAKPFGAASGYYDITMDGEQTAHITGDVRSGETQDGWCNAPSYSDDKYPLASTSYCVGHGGQGDPVTSHPGIIYPCVNTQRSYGEIYSGYFVPAKTGVYKFRTTVVDNTVMLRIAPTEYYEDARNIFAANWRDANLEQILRSLINYPTQDFSSVAAQNSEFAGTGTGSSLTNYRAVPYDTTLFYNLSGIPTSGGNYVPGYVYLKQGNVYAFEMRFGEGGGSVSFNFEYNRKDVGSSTWDGWTPMDASVVVPDAGSDAHEPQMIPVATNVVNFNAANLFYDAEQDLLTYSARLVNVDGSAYSGPGGTDHVSEIGLSINAQTGSFTGTLTPAFLALPSKPRVVFMATETRANPNPTTSSLPIKFQE